MTPTNQPSSDRIKEIAGLPAIVDGPPRARRTLALAHGAGAGMEHEFMERVAAGIAAEGIRVGRFEFPYMAARRHGQRRGPDREAVLRQSWMAVIEALGARERLALLNARLEVNSHPGNGARVTVILPDNLFIAQASEEPQAGNP